jgi:hypothetical protein
MPNPVIFNKRVRPITLAAAGGILALALFPTTAVAQPDPYAESKCFYELSAPAPITLPGGGPAVAAEIEMTHCTGLAQSVRTTACVGPTGDNGHCTTKNGYVPSRAFTPGAANGSYTATGEGCYRLRSDMVLQCVPAGPVTSAF